MYHTIVKYLIGDIEVSFFIQHRTYYFSSVNFLSSDYIIVKDPWDPQGEATRGQCKDCRSVLDYFKPDSVTRPAHWHPTLVFLSVLKTKYPQTAAWGEQTLQSYLCEMKAKNRPSDSCTCFVNMNHSHRAADTTGNSGCGFSAAVSFILMCWTWWF